MDSSMSGVEFLDESTVRRHLSWDSLVPVIEKGFSDVSKKNGSAIQPPRLVMPVPQKNGVLLTMPGFSNTQDALGCKLVTSFTDNKKRNIPSILATIFLFDSDTGKLKVVMEGTAITEWRTAAASVVATKLLHKGPKNVLAVLGAGAQARIHIIALQHCFGFKEVRIWNRTLSRAQQLCDSFGDKETYKVCPSNEECVRGADVICTTTYATEPILFWDWVTEGAHINAVGGAITHYSELDRETYKNGSIVVDSLDNAKKELKGLIDMGIPIWGEVGDVVNKSKPLPQPRCTIFHSLGMAIEDVLTANYVYKNYKEVSKSRLEMENK